MKNSLPRNKKDLFEICNLESLNLHTDIDLSNNKSNFNESKDIEYDDVIKFFLNFISK